MNTIADDVYVIPSQPDFNKIAIAESFVNLHLLPQIETEIFSDRLLRSLHAHAFECRPGTWRNRRNALAYYYDFADDSEFACDIKMMKNPVTDEDADEASRALKPKKQKRTHKVIDKEHAKIISYLEKIGDYPVLGAVMIARTIGVRPAEMASMKFDDIQQSISITGAKKRKQGDRGIDRTLILESDDYVIVKRAWTQLMTEFNREDALPDRAMKRIQNRFYKQVRKIFDDRKSYPSLYSYRHQFGSDLKASGMDRITIAAIMGHASVESVNAYGDRRHGGRKMNVDVSDESLDAVKKVKVSSPPSKSNASDNINDNREASEKKPLTLSSPEVIDADNANPILDVTQSEDNQPPADAKESDETASPEPYTKMINGSKAVMF